MGALINVTLSFSMYPVFVLPDYMDLANREQIRIDSWGKECLERGRKANLIASVQLQSREITSVQL